MDTRQVRAGTDCPGGCLDWTGPCRGHRLRCRAPSARRNSFSTRGCGPRTSTRPESPTRQMPPRCAPAWDSRPARCGVHRCWSKARPWCRSRTTTGPTRWIPRWLPTRWWRIPNPTRSTVSRSPTPAIPGTTLTLGRQRVLLDDQRFVGNVGWRQNEQTFDAFRVVNKSVKNLVLDATYLNRVNRVFGEDSPQGTYQGDTVLLNAATRRLGKFTGFGYLLEFDPIVGVPRRRTTRPRPTACGSRARRRRARSRSATSRPGPARATRRESLSFDLDYVMAELTAPTGNWPRRRHRGARRQRRKGIHDAAGDAAQVPGLGRQVPDHAGERHRGHLRKCHRQPQGHWRHGQPRHRVELPRLSGRAKCPPTMARNGMRR